MERTPGVAVGNDTVETDLVEVGRLELQHLVDARAIDLVRGLADVISCIVTTTELCVDQLLAELVEEIECSEVGAAGDLNQLCETVPYLPLGQGP